MADLKLAPGPSLWVLTPNSEEAGEFLEERIPADCPRWGKGYAVEGRFIGPILDDLLDNGFSVE